MDGVTKEGERSDDEVLIAEEVLQDVPLGHWKGICGRGPDIAEKVFSTHKQVDGVDATGCHGTGPRNPMQGELGPRKTQNDRLQTIQCGRIQQLEIMKGNGGDEVIDRRITSRWVGCIYWRNAGVSQSDGHRAAVVHPFDLLPRLDGHVHDVLVKRNPDSGG